MVRFSCPCGRDLKADDDKAGRKVRCPECRETIIVPLALDIDLGDLDSFSPDIVQSSARESNSTQPDNSESRWLRRSIAGLILATFAGVIEESLRQGISNNNKLMGEQQIVSALTPPNLVKSVEGDQPPTVKTCDSPACQLASLNLGHPFDESSEFVTPYRLFLQSDAEYCGMPEAEIADLVTRTVITLKEDHRYTNVLIFMTAMTKMAREKNMEGNGSLDLKEFCQEYIRLRTVGDLEHIEAIRKMRQ